MLKEAASLAGGALIFSPLGVPVVLHGVAGMIVGGAGLFVADSILKQVVDVMNNPDSQRGFPQPAEPEQD